VRFWLWRLKMMSEANKYHAYARECFRLADKVDNPDIGQTLIELARAWMKTAREEEGALSQERQSLDHLGSEEADINGSERGHHVS
jgi:hypothetical protein